MAACNLNHRSSRFDCQSMEAEPRKGYHQAMDRKPLGRMIQELRKGKGMTQLELAGKMNVTDKAVSKWERGLSYPDTASLPALAEILGVSVDELMQCSSRTKEEGMAKARDIAKMALNAVAVAMGIASTVLAVMDEIDAKTGITLLGIGLACLAIAAMDSRD